MLSGGIRQIVGDGNYPRLGAGLALVLGAVLNYVVSPKGNPLLLFGGILLVCAAIAANAMAYRGLQKAGKSGTKGILLSLLCGVVIGLFYPFVAKALIRDYLKGSSSAHVWGVLGGLIWGTGTICSFVVAYTPMVGPATSFSLSEGNTMISAIWGVFVWKEFHGASSEVKRLLALMFALFVVGLVSISLAPVFS